MSRGKKVLDKGSEIGYNVPQSLPVCGEEVPVEISPDLEHDGEFRPDDMEKDQRSTIHIHGKVAPACQERVLLHEGIHAILWSTGLSEILGDRAEEAVCTTLDKHLPALIERLIEGREGRKKPRPRATRDKATRKGTRRKK